MDLDGTVSRVKNGGVTVISRDDLALLLGTAELLREDNTSIAGVIRTLRFGDHLLIQERTPEGVHYLREVPSEHTARCFVDARLAAYERMWDG